MRLLLLSLALVVVTGCRTVAPGGTVTSMPLEGEGEGGSSGRGTPSAGASEDEDRRSGRASFGAREVHGFSLTGPETCLPLEAHRRCLERPDVTAEVCAARGGEPRRCDDCRVLCSVALVE